MLNVLLNRIIEKRLEYYMPLEDEEEGAIEEISDNEENDS
jgi:hypothetical protein